FRLLLDLVAHRYVVRSLFFTHPPSPALYTLSLHDALPISQCCGANETREIPGLFNRRFSWPANDSNSGQWRASMGTGRAPEPSPDRKSTRLNSSHVSISYAVFCLKKKNRSYNECYMYEEGA